MTAPTRPTRDRVATPRQDNASRPGPACVRRLRRASASHRSQPDSRCRAPSRGRDPRSIPQRGQLRRERRGCRATATSSCSSSNAPLPTAVEMVVDRVHDLLLRILHGLAHCWREAQVGLRKSPPLWWSLRCTRRPAVRSPWSAASSTIRIYGIVRDDGLGIRGRRLPSALSRASWSANSLI